MINDLEHLPLPLARLCLYLLFAASPTHAIHITHIFEMFCSQFYDALCSFSLFSPLLFIFIRFGRNRRHFQAAPNLIIALAVRWRIGTHGAEKLRRICTHWCDDDTRSTRSEPNWTRPNVIVVRRSRLHNCTTTHWTECGDVRVCIRIRRFLGRRTEEKKKLKYQKYGGQRTARNTSANWMANYFIRSTPIPPATVSFWRIFCEIMRQIANAIKFAQLLSIGFRFALIRMKVDFMSDCSESTLDWHQLTDFPVLNSIDITIAFLLLTENTNYCFESIGTAALVQSHKVKREIVFESKFQLVLESITSCTLRRYDHNRVFLLATDSNESEFTIEHTCFARSRRGQCFAQ